MPRQQNLGTLNGEINLFFVKIQTIMKHNNELKTGINVNWISTDSLDNDKLYQAVRWFAVFERIYVRNKSKCLFHEIIFRK